MSIGIDLVHIPEFENRLNTLGGFEKVFTEYEIATHISLESRAGVFAAKEAYMKAIGKKIDWLSIWLEKKESGKPFLQSDTELTTKPNVSISHSGDYAIAIVQL